MPNRRTIHVLGCILALALCLGHTLRRAPVAVLVGVTGKVEVHKAGAPKPAGAAVGLALNAGDRVIVPSGGRAVLMYSTGKMETASATVTLAAPEREDRGGLYSRTLNTITQVATTDVDRQPNRQGMIRPVQGTPTPIAPRNNVTLLEVRPRFIWFKFPDASSHIVQIRRTDLPGARPVRFAAGSDTSWSYPAAAPALVPGGSYEWTVGSASGGRVGQLQKFRVVGADEFAQVTRTMQELASAGVDPATDGLFVMALTYRDAGLLYEAESALSVLASGGSGNGRIYHLLRGEVLDGLGRLEAAAKEFAAADAEAEQ